LYYARVGLELGIFCICASVLGSGAAFGFLIGLRMGFDLYSVMVVTFSCLVFVIMIPVLRGRIMSVQRASIGPDKIVPPVRPTSTNRSGSIFSVRLDEVRGAVEFHPDMRSTYPSARILGWSSLGAVVGLALFLEILAAVRSGLTGFEWFLVLILVSFTGFCLAATAQLFSARRRVARMLPKTRPDAICLVANSGMVYVIPRGLVGDVLFETLSRSVQASAGKIPVAKATTPTDPGAPLYGFDLSDSLGSEALAVFTAQSSPNTQAKDKEITTAPSGPKRN
jgi:hypothetical protein